MSIYKADEVAKSLKNALDEDSRGKCKDHTSTLRVKFFDLLHLVEGYESARETLKKLSKLRQAIQEVAKDDNFIDIDKINLIADDEIDNIETDEWGAEGPDCCNEPG